MASVMPDPAVPGPLIVRSTLRGFFFCLRYVEDVRLSLRGPCCRRPFCASVSVPGERAAVVAPSTAGYAGSSGTGFVTVCASSLNTTAADRFAGRFVPVYACAREKVRASLAGVKGSRWLGVPPPWQARWYFVLWSNRS